jgi:hypothetical protein
LTDSVNAWFVERTDGRLYGGITCHQSAESRRGQALIPSIDSLFFQHPFVPDPIALAGDGVFSQQIVCSNPVKGFFIERVPGGQVQAGIAVEQGMVYPVVEQPGVGAGSQLPFFDLHPV